MFSALLRLGGTIPVAALVTFAVFWVMQGLISSGGSVINEDDGIKIERFVMDEVDDSVQTKERKPNKPPTPPKEPPKPDIPKPEVSKADTSDLDVSGFDISANINIDAGLSGAASDGEYLPFFRPAPNYPRRAAQRGLEGYVVVEFTVTSLGTTKDIIVIEAQPQKVFDRAAIKSVERWKFKPTIEDGKAIDVPGVRNIIRFQLEK